MQLFLLPYILSLSVTVVKSVLTPAALLEVVRALPCVSYTEALWQGLEADMLLDVSYEPLTTERLAALSEEREMVLVVLGPKRPGKPGKWTFYLGGETAEWVSALRAVLQWLKVETANLISDLSSFSLHLKESLTLQTPNVRWATHLFSHQSAQYLMGNVIRPYGNRFSVFAASAEATKRVLKAQFQMHIGGAGYANVLLEESALFTLGKDDFEANLYEGNLIIAREITSNATNEQEFYRVLYGEIEPYLTLNPAELLLRLESDFPTHTLVSPYLLLNLQNGTRRIVGEVKGFSCEIQAPVRYLGSVLSPPGPSKASIPLSGNFGGEVVGSVRYTTDSQTIGAVIALEEINSLSELLPNFELECWNFTGGIGPVSPEMYRDIISHPDSLGTSIFSGITSINTLTMLSFLRNHRIAVPVVGSAATSPALSSRAAFPHFIRTCIDDQFVNLATVQVIRRLGWTRIALIVVDSPSNLRLQRDFLHLLGTSNVTIVTPAAYQVVVSASSLEQARANYTASFQHLIASRCRIVLLLSTDNYQYVPVVLYEMGIRKGDLVIISRDLHVEIATGLSYQESVSIAEVFHTSLQLQPTSFTGAIGQSVFQAVSQRLSMSPSTYACYYYDSAYTIAQALAWLLHSGKDFHNSTAMMSALRGVRFVGCTGFVYFDSYSNNRQNMRFMVETTRYNESKGLFSETIGMFDPVGITLLAFNEGFKWSDGSANLPSNMRESTLNCPFEDRFLQTFQPGLAVFIAISTGIWALTVGVAVAVYRRMRVEVEELVERREVETADCLVMAGVAVELAQLVALGPKLHFLGMEGNKALDISIARLSLSPSENSFLGYWAALESAVWAWLLFTVLCKVLERRLRHSLLARFSADLGFLVSNWLFVPFIFNLLNVFKCTQGTANIGQNVTFASSFLDFDCYFPCWSLKHIIFAVLTAFTLVIFVAISTWSRVKWQKTTILLNIKSGVAFLTLKSPVLVLFTAISQAFRDNFWLLHAISHLIILLCYLFLCVKPITSYCYRKVRIWHRISLLLCIQSTISALFSQQITSIPGFIFPLVTLLGWFCLLFLGGLYVLLRVPSLLYRPRGISTFYLFKFAFQPITQDLARNLQLEFEKYSRKCVFKPDFVSPQPITVEVDTIALEIRT